GPPNRGESSADARRVFALSLPPGHGCHSGWRVKVRIRRRHIAWEEGSVMSQYDYDLFVIGAGSGGVRAARFSADYGARVAIAEERFFGGTCVNIGCVPKKLMVYASHFAEEFEDAAGYGWTVGERSFDWPTLIANKDREIARLNGIYKRLLDGSGVEVFEARATVLDAHRV